MQYIYIYFYLKQIPNVNNKSSRERFNIHTTPTILNLQPTNMVLLHHREHPWIRMICNPNRQIRLWAVRVVVPHHPSLFQTRHLLQPLSLQSQPLAKQLRQELSQPFDLSVPLNHLLSADLRDLILIRHLRTQS